MELVPRQEKKRFLLGDCGFYTDVTNFPDLVGAIINRPFGVAITDELPY